MDPYKVLFISKDANDKDIKQAYRKLALKYHPDKNTNNTTNNTTNNKEKFVEINTAYSILINKNRRALYDSGVPITENTLNEMRNLSNIFGIIDPDKIGEEDYEQLNGIFKGIFGEKDMCKNIKSGGMEKLVETVFTKVVTEKNSWIYLLKSIVYLIFYAFWLLIKSVFNSITNLLCRH